MKASSKIYKGIEYIVVTELPQEQQLLLEQKNIEKIKIMVEGKIISNCISYQQYSDWFHSVWKQRKPEIKKSHTSESFAPLKILVNKA